MRKSIIILLILAAIGSGFLIGRSTSLNTQATSISSSTKTTIINGDSGQPRTVDFDQFWTVWRMIHDDFVDQDKIKDPELVYGAIQGMVNAVGDPYTVYFKPKDSQNFSQQISGAFGGIGIEIGMRKNIVTVIAPIKNTPAERAGLRAGDQILKIDNQSTENFGIDDAVDKIRGKVGTVVTLLIYRDGLEKPVVYSIKRETIKIPAVNWTMQDDNTAVLSIYVFNKNVDDEFKKAAREITESNAKRIVLDLRNNPGGLLDSAVTIASYFMDEKSPVLFERFGDGKEQRYYTEKNGLLKNMPLVILINKGSASASEILAGDLRDVRHAKVLGETSFGKGSVQIVNDLSDKSSVKITIAKWFTPNGTSINETGVIPDVTVLRASDDFENNKDPQLNKALELVKTL